MVQYMDQNIAFKQNMVNGIKILQWTLNLLKNILKKLRIGGTAIII